MPDSKPTYCIVGIGWADRPDQTEFLAVKGKLVVFDNVAIAQETIVADPTGFASATMPGRGKPGLKIAGRRAPGSSSRLRATTWPSQSQSFTSSTYQTLLANSLRAQGLDARLQPARCRTRPSPMASRGAVGRQQLRFRLGCRVAIDDVVLGVRPRSEYVEGLCGGG